MFFIILFKKKLNFTFKTEKNDWIKNLIFLKFLN